MSTGDDIAKAAESYVGRARWRHRGRKPWALDCVGLVVCAHRDAGVPLEDVRGYGRHPWNGQLQKELARQSDPVKRDEEQPGDIVVLRWRLEEPHHLGIVGSAVHGRLTVVHCENLNGCVRHAMDCKHLHIVEVRRAWPAK